MLSLYKQRLPKNIKIELIVADGQSTDNTLSIINRFAKKMKQKFGDRFLRLLVMRENIGVGYARNLVLKEAKGEWILWLDSDNILSELYISKAAEKIGTVEEKTAVIYPSKVIPLSFTHNIIQKSISCYMKLIAGSNPDSKASWNFQLPYTAMQGTICKTEILRKIGGFNSHLIAAEDIDLFLRLINEGYFMESFGGMLIYFVRSSLRSWFKQAATWAYGKSILMDHDSVLSSVHNVGSSRSKMYNFISHNIKIFRNLVLNAFSRCPTFEALSVPMLYLYRRIGYFYGHMLALKYIQNINKNEKQ